MSVTFWILWLLGLAISSVFGAYVVNRHRDRGLFILGTMLAIYVVSANILVPRLIDLKIFGMSFIVVTGAMIWPYTAQLTDMINEIYGRKSAIFAAVVAYLANIMFVIFVIMAIQTPPFVASADAEPWFRSFFGVAGRVLFASMCSYTIANFVDISLFAAIKKRFFKKERTVGDIFVYSGLRSAVSDGVNMIIDSAIFYTIAFIGTMPTATLLSLIGSSMLAKFILSQIDIPFYFVFRLMTRDVEREF